MVNLKIQKNEQWFATFFLIFVGYMASIRRCDNTITSYGRVIQIIEAVCNLVELR